MSGLPLTGKEFLEQQALALRSRLQKTLEELQNIQTNLSSRERETLMQSHISRIESLISSHSDAVVQRALTMTHLIPDSQDFRGRYPLHEICDVSGPTKGVVSIIRLFLEKEPSQQAVLHRSRWGDIPLHFVCNRPPFTKHSIAAVDLLLKHDSSKRSLMTPWSNTFLPIHKVCE